MFPLRDKTRRRITLGSFVVLCLVPTLAVLAYGVRRHLPGYAATEADRFGRRLGLDISIDTVRHLRPRSIQYEGFVASDPETGVVLFRCRSLEASWKHTTNDNDRPQTDLILIVSGVELNAATFEELWGIVDRVFRRQTGWPDLDARLSIGELTLVNGESSHTLFETRGHVEILMTSSQVEFNFRPAESQAGKPATLHIARDSGPSPPISSISLSSGSSGLDCSLLSVGLEGLDHFGPTSRFFGSLGANETHEGWHGGIKGHFTRVTPQERATGRSPRLLVGTSNWNVIRADFQDERLETEANFFSPGMVQIGRTLLESLLSER